MACREAYSFHWLIVVVSALVFKEAHADLRATVKARISAKTNANASPSNNAPSSSSKSWMSSEQNRQNSLCINGHLVPQLFVLGLQKAGSTNFCSGLDKVVFPKWTGVHYGNAYFTPKEPHFFDLPNVISEDVWLDHYPKCPTNGERRIAIDCTPNYLLHPQSPWSISARFGQLKSHLYFVVLLREPIARLQSWFYFFLRNAHANTVRGSRALLRQRQWHTSANTTFAEFASIQMKLGMWNADETPTNSKLRTMVSYAPALQRYLNLFKESRFLVVPYKLTLSPHGLKGVLDQAGEELNLPIASREPNPLSGSHPTLEDDLPSDLLAELREQASLNGGSSRSIVNVSAGHSNVALAGYKGKVGDMDGMVRHIETYW